MDQEAGKKKEELTVKKSGKRGGRSPQPPEIKRHYSMLSPEETDELVEDVARLIVEHVKQKGIDSLKGSTGAPGGVDKPEPEPPRDGHSRKE